MKKCHFNKITIDRKEKGEHGEKFFKMISVCTEKLCQCFIC